MKIDLHLHSRVSKRPSQWILQKLGAPESFSDPLFLYRHARKLGMDAFTLTDHNAIEGCLETAHLPGSFISEEATTYFPEDGCKVHVLAWDIDENTHREIQRLRENIYDLTAYLQEEGIAHGVAHPLYSINNLLSPDHFEKLLLLFKVMELNGARDEAQNQVLGAVVRGLDAAKIQELADKHHLEPGFARPWEKILVGGSDDHSALNVARRYTEVPEASTLAEFKRGLGGGRALPRGQGSPALAMAHNLYGIAYQFFTHRFQLDRYANADLLKSFLDRLLKPESQGPSWLLVRLRGLMNSGRRRHATREKVQDLFRVECENLIINDPEVIEFIRTGQGGGLPPEERWFQFVNRVANKTSFHFGKKLMGPLTGGNVFSVFNTIGAAGSLFFLLGPYFVAFGLQGRDRRLTREISARLLPAAQRARAKEVKVAHFTDTFYDINGVSQTLRRQADLAARTGKDLTIVTCAGNQPRAAGRVRHFRPVSVYQLPEYPQQKIYLPPFLEMLRFVHEGGFTYLHSATPGPIGLAALGIARILHLPISGTYHTQIPQYAAHLTKDPAIEELTWRFTIWYYDQMDKIYVPSSETGRELASRGISPDKIRLYPRGVDLELFHPGRRNGFYQRRYKLAEGLKLLYVGRVSREKNLPLLAEAFKRAGGGMPGLQLVVVGEGPYLPELKQELKGRPVTFTGYLHGEQLAQAYASADLFVFPSTTDTFGNVVLEAQASGLPVIVTDGGGPRENMAPGQTGLVVPGGDAAALARAITSLAGDPERLATMSREARRHMEARSFEAAFERHWNMYAQDAAGFDGSGGDQAVLAA